MKLTPFLGVPLAAGVLFTGPLRAAADSCAICGVPLGAMVYLVQDKVTEEKKEVCYDCAVFAPRCWLCNLPVKGQHTDLPDGRVICPRDAKTAVLEPEEARRITRETVDNLDRLFSRFLSWPDTNVTIALVDRVRMLELFKYPGNDYVCPNVLGFLETRTNQGWLQYSISLLSALPLGQFKATCAHEYAHAWQDENLSARRRQTLSPDAAEGFCELVSFMLVDSQNDEAAKRQILLNVYTRGQIQAFLEAEKRYGFNDIVDWMKYGTDDRLYQDELDRVRRVEMPRTPSGPAVSLAAYSREPAPPPDTLVLKAVFWRPDRPIAQINNRSFGVKEEASVRVGHTNLLVRCLAIRQDSVRIQIVGSDQEQELRFPNPPW